MEPWLPFVASCYCAGQLCQASNLKSNITSSHCLASWWRMHLCSSSVPRTYRTKSMYVIWFICKLSSWAMQWCVHSQLYQSHLRKATLYCSIVAGFNPQLNHSLLIMIFSQVLRFFVANPIRRYEVDKSVYFSIIVLADDLFELLGLEIHVGSLWACL